MRLPKWSEEREKQKEMKKVGREMAKTGWSSGSAEAGHTAELEQQHLTRGKGHHLARSFKGHV